MTMREISHAEYLFKEAEITNGFSPEFIEEFRHHPKFQYIVEFLIVNSNVYGLIEWLFKEQIRLESDFVKIQSSKPPTATLVLDPENPAHADLIKIWGNCR